LLKKILVALDGSLHAKNALTFALDLAEKYTATVEVLTVFHNTHLPIVVNPVNSVNAFSNDIMLDCMKAQKTQQEELLSHTVTQVHREHPQLQVTATLKEGRPAEQIIKFAKEGNHDVIIMGNRGLGGIKQLLLGSVSDRVADGAPCPVLIVKATCNVLY
jgi:nucleotide-binding universal stress UspA family protein